MKKHVRFLAYFIVMVLCFTVVSPSISLVYASDGLISDSEKKDSGVYKNSESGDGSARIIFIDSESGSGEDEPSWFVQLLIDLMIALGDGFNYLLSEAGMTIENIIYGRVDGHGIRLAGGGKNVVTSFFTFELEKGNAYGVIAAMLYQKIRGFMYVLMFLLCFIKLIMIGMKSDYEKLRMDFSTFAQSAVIAMALMVFMPYLFDLYTYIRDMGLKFIVSGSTRELIGRTSSLIDAYRSSAENSLVGAILYLGIVAVSVIFASIYTAYNMGMLVHFILFPGVCVKSIVNRKALSEWVLSAIGLTIMPVIDGVLLLVPLIFNSIGLGLLALIAAGCLTSARNQARETLGIRSNGMDARAMMSVIGMAQLARGVGQGVKNAAGRLAGGMKSAKADEDMANYYSERAGQQGDAGAAGADAGSSGQALKDPNSTMATPDPIAEKHANINNFEDRAFSGKLSDDRMAELYRQRASKSRLKSVLGAGGAVAGGVAGGVVGFGATSFMGSGMQMFATGLGVSTGSTVGGFAGDAMADFRYRPSRVTGESGGMRGVATDGANTGANATTSETTGLATIGPEHVTGTVEDAEVKGIGVRADAAGIPMMKASDQDTRVMMEVAEKFRFDDRDERVMRTTESGKSIRCSMQASCLDTDSKIASIGQPQYEETHNEYLRLKNDEHAPAERLERCKAEGLEKIRSSLCLHVSEGVANRCANDSFLQQEKDTPEIRQCIEKAAVNAAVKFYNSEKCSNVNLAAHGFTFDWD